MRRSCMLILPAVIASLLLAVMLPTSVVFATEQSAAEGAQRIEQAAPNVLVRAKVKDQGWAKQWTAHEVSCGVDDSGLCLQAIRLRLSNKGSHTGSIRYRSYVESRGWQGWKKPGKTSGSTKKGQGIGAVQIRLTGEIADAYDVYYCVYAQSLGWMAWAKNGETAGIAGKGLCAEAIRIELVAKKDVPPAPKDQAVEVPFMGEEDIRVSAYTQGLGWASNVAEGKVVGLAGSGLPIEALKATLVGARVPGSVKVCTYSQDSGWSGWKKGGRTSGKAKSGWTMGAMRVRLTGEAADAYDVCYRVCVQGVGWLGWARNGGIAGSTNPCLAVEAVRIALVEKGAADPANDGSNWPNPVFGKSRTDSDATSGTYRMALGTTDTAVAGLVIYRAHGCNGEWGDWETNEGGVVAPRVSVPIDGIQLHVTGAASEVYDIWYRARVLGIGWTEWVKNGEFAGNIGSGQHVDAIQTRLAKKNEDEGPSPAGSSFQDWAICESLDVAKSSRTVTSFGDYAMSKKVKRGLTDAVTDLRDRGFDVGFIMMDLQTHKGVAYNCDAVFYGASSIKAPYFASVVSRHPDAIKSYQHNITEAMFYSWDYDYKQVLAAYGKDPMRAWCLEAGVRTEIAESLPWANYSARELAKMWGRTYVLYQQSSAAEQLGKWCERPNFSTIHATLSDKYRTRSKAGWISAGGVTDPNINGGGPLWCVCNDGGIVYANNGDYVMAILSSVPANHDMLNQLTAAIDVAHTAM